MGLSQTNTKPGVATEKCDGARGLLQPGHTCHLWPQAFGVKIILALLAIVILPVGTGPCPKL